jgi:hypothetical protein
MRLHQIERHPVQLTVEQGRQLLDAALGAHADREAQAAPADDRLNGAR